MENFLATDIEFSNYARTAPNFNERKDTYFHFWNADCIYVFHECNLLFNLKGDISNDKDFRYIADCVASFQDCKFGPFYKDSDHQS